MLMGLQTEDWALGAERRILVWHGGGGDGGRAGKTDGIKEGEHQSALSCWCCVDVYITHASCALPISLHIDVNLSLRMDLYR